MSKWIHFVLISLLTFSVVAYADKGGGGHGKGHGQGHVGHAQGHAKGNVKTHTHPGHFAANKIQPSKTTAHFSQTDRKKITTYVNANPSSVLGTSLPPGIAKNVARGKPLPPGIEKVFLPNGVLSTLPAHPGFEYRVVGNDVVLVDKKTEIVSDILSNVLK